MANHYRPVKVVENWTLYGYMETEGQLSSPMLNRVDYFDTVEQAESWIINARPANPEFDSFSAKPFTDDPSRHYHIKDTNEYYWLVPNYSGYIDWIMA